MPCYGRDCATNWLLKVLRHPPVVFLFKVTDGDETSSGTGSKLVLEWRPAHTSGRTVYTEEDECRLPSSRRGFPDVGIAIFE